MTCVCKIPRIFNQQCFRNTLRLLSTKTSQASKHVLDEMYNTDEKQRILECFNKCSPEELQFTRQLSHQKASAVVSYREKNGDFETLSDLLRVPGVGILGLQKLCNIMKSLDYTAVQKLREKLEVETVRTSPPFPESLQENLASLVAIELHTDSIAYAMMSRDMTLESWETIPLLPKPFQKVDHVLFLEKLMQVVERLPQSDAYVFESKIYRYTSLRVVPYLTNLRILEAMLVTLLNSQLATTGQHHAFFLKPNSVMRFFSLAVGGERVSGQHIIRELQRRAPEDVDSTSMVADVHVPAGLWEQYWLEQSVGQERLANCFLLAVAFYKLVVLRTHSLQF